jgi:hypothetical protein
MKALCSANTTPRSLILAACHRKLYDNMKTVTTGQDAESKPIWQRSFADFAGRYGFTPKCARPYRAKTKGKVERTIGFIRRSFLAGRTFADITDANVQLKTWLAEVNMRRHGTHGEFVHERFAAERPLLIQLRRDMLTIERSSCEPSMPREQSCTKATITSCHGAFAGER